MTFLALLLSLQGLLAEEGNERLQVDVSPFFHGLVRAHEWTGLHVLLNNPTEEDLFLLVEASFVALDRPRDRFQRVVALPRGARKRLPMLLLAAGEHREIRVTCRNESGKILAGVTIPLILIRHEDLHIASVGLPMPGLEHANTFQAAAINQTRGEVRLSRVAAADLPEREAGMESVDILTFGESDLGEMDPEQIIAIHGWVEQGGILVLSPGREWQSFRSAIPEEIYPASIRDVVSMPIGRALGRLGGVEGALDFDAPVLRGEFPGADVLLETNGIPLVARWRLGRGSIYSVHFPPASLSRFNPEQAGRIWAAILDPPKPLSTVPVQENFMGNEFSMVQVLAQTLSGKASENIGIGWVALLILIYLAAVGPVDYLLVRKLRRPVLTWITFPLMVVVFSGVFYWKAHRLKAGPMQLRQISLVDVSPGRAHQRIRSWAGIYSQENRDYSISCRLPATLWGPGLSSVLEGGPDPTISPVILQEREGAGMRARIPIWTLKLVRADVDQPERWLEVQSSGNRVVAKLDSRAPFALQECVLITPENPPLVHYWHTFGLAPGGEVSLMEPGLPAASPLEDWLIASGIQPMPMIYPQMVSYQTEEWDSKAIKALLLCLMFRPKMPDQEWIKNQPYFPILKRNRFLDLSSCLEHGQAVFLAWRETAAMGIAIQDAELERTELSLVRCVFPWNYWADSGPDQGQ